MGRILAWGAGLAMAGLAAAGPAAAQTRSWVSGTGNDANPCSRTAPCQTFSGAISKTAAGGEIDCLDGGAFGAVTIAQSVTIDCRDTLAGVQVSGTNGITIAGSGIAVILRGLDINGLGTGLAGIKVTAAASLVVEDCKVYGFGASATPAIDIVPSQATAFKLDLQDVTVSNNANGGILIAPSGGGTVGATLNRVAMHTSTYGVRAQDGAKVNVFHSVASNNTNNGILAVSGGGAVEINLAHSIAAGNGTNGVVTSGAPATIRLVEDVITDNATGVNVGGGGTVIGSTPATSFNAGNANPGTPNGSASALQ